MSKKVSKSISTRFKIAREAAVLTAVICGILFLYLNKMDVHAQDTTWQNDWNAEPNSTEGVIYLRSYKTTASGNNLAINVPGTATIGGVDYVTFIAPSTELFSDEMKEKVVSFTVGDGVVIDKAYGLFDGMTNLKTVDLSKAIFTDDVTDMRYMFKDCSSLEKVDLSGLNTGSITEMNAMFSGCESLESADLRGFDTGNVLYMAFMFKECKSLKTLQLGNNFKTDKVTEMNQMFLGCSSINELDLSKFKLTGIEDNGDSDIVVDLFGDNDSLKKLTIPSAFGYVDEFKLPTTMFEKINDTTIGTEEYTTATPTMAGKTFVVITDKEKVKIKASDKTVTYDGNAIDISGMFEISENAGAASYEVTSGTATLNGALLTVTKAGKYVISVCTEETARFQAESAKATLTVKRAYGKGDITCDDVTYGSKPSPKASSSTNPGDPVFLYRLSSEGDNTYSVDVPTNPGKYTVKALFPDTDFYEFSCTAEFTIKKPKNNGGNENGELREESGNSASYGQINEATISPELKEKGIDSVDQVKKEFIDQLGLNLDQGSEQSSEVGITGTMNNDPTKGYLFSDVTMQVSTGTGTGQRPATEADFPAEGIPVILLYPAGTNGNDYVFSVAHMVGKTTGTMTAGTIETPAVTNTASGIRANFHGLSPVLITWTKKSSNPEPKATSHSHRMEWKVMREATEDRDGEEAYICDECGYVEYTMPLSAFGAFQKNVINQIKNAGQNATVAITTDRWISFHRSVADALKERPDVTLTVSFLDEGYRGNRRSFTIPKGTDLLSIFGDDNFAGFLYLGGKFGMTLQ